MSLSPTALEALRAAQTAFTVSEADVFEDALSRGLEVMDREGRLVGAHSAEELLRLRARVAELEQQIVALSAQRQVLQARPADGITRAIAPTQALREPEGEFHSFLHHDYRPGLGHDLPRPGDAS